MARSSFLPCRMDAARLVNTSFGSLSRSCRTPKVLTPKYWDVDPGIPSSLKPGAILGSRLVISFRRVLRGVRAAVIWNSALVEIVARKCKKRTIDRSNSPLEANYARNAAILVQDLQKFAGRS